MNQLVQHPSFAPEAVRRPLKTFIASFIGFLSFFVALDVYNYATTGFAFKVDGTILDHVKLALMMPTGILADILLMIVFKPEWRYEFPSMEAIHIVSSSLFYALLVLIVLLTRARFRSLTTMVLANKRIKRTDLSAGKFNAHTQKK